MIAAATWDIGANRWRFEGTVSLNERAEMGLEPKDVNAAGGVLYFRCLPTAPLPKIGAFINPRRLLDQYWDKLRAVREWAK